MTVKLTQCCIQCEIHYMRNVQFVRVCSHVGRYFYNVYSKKFEIVFSSNVKDNNLCPCVHNKRLSYNIYKCFISLQIRMRMSIEVDIRKNHGLVK